MNTKKFLMRFLKAVMLLALLTATACSTKSTINDADRQALIEQANAFMAKLQGGDYQAMYAMMTTETQKILDTAKGFAGGFVNVEDVIVNATSNIAKWSLDGERVMTEWQTGQTIVTGTVEYRDGTRGTVRLGFKKQDGAWKVASSSLEQ